MLGVRCVVAVLLLSTLFIQGTFGLSVSGNKLIDASGQPVTLRGLVKPSFEWSPVGEHASLSDYTLMRQWGGNIVRITMNQGYWLSASSSYQPGYQATIKQQVDWIKSLGMYCILDLHWSDTGNLNAAPGQQNMADVNSAKFWNQVATAYKNDPYVLFELYNEPHDVSWSVWLNGGSGWYGMQQLYDAVRGTGAQNVIIINGLNWAYDLSGVAANPVVGTNIAYSTHPYNYAGKGPDQWDASFGYLTANYPVFATEFGQYCDGSNYVSTFLAYCQSKGIHWTAWAWYVQGCGFPSVIDDWNGTPSSPVGVAVKAALGGGGSVGPTAIPTQSPTVPPAGSNQLVYTDSLLNGWISYGWASDLTYSATAYVRSGTYSISFTPSGDAAVYLHQAVAFDPRAYQLIQFYINGGTNSGQSLKVIVYNSAANVFANPVTLPSSVAAGSWVLQTIPISSFGITAGATISGFAIQGLTATVPIVYIDDITLVTGSVSTPAPTSAPTQGPTPAPTARPSTAPTSAPTSVPTATPAPTPAPTKPPTAAPTATPAPTVAPTKQATSAPTVAPTTPATSAPTKAPTSTIPTPAPTATKAPTNAPTKVPTAAPTIAPTKLAPTTAPTTAPTSAPTAAPTAPPTSSPTLAPTGYGTIATITVVVNDGTNVWWIGFNSFSGFPYTITAVNIKDSSPNPVWYPVTNQGWGWTFGATIALVSPVTIQIVGGTHIATLPNIVTSFGGATISAMTTVS